MKRKLAAIVTSAASTAVTASSFAVNAFAEGEAASTPANAAGNPLVTFVIPMVLMFVLLYFMAIKPQKKREQEAKEMQNSLQVGDEIVTSGGIVGMVFRIGDDTVVIETGGERNKLRIKKWAIAENVTAAERMKESQGKTKSPLAAAGLSEDTEKKSKKSKKKADSEEE